MAKYNIEYFIRNRYNGFYVPQQQFHLEDVCDYYDLYDDGTIIIYIKQIYLKYGFWKTETIIPVDDEHIRIVIYEIPERRQCGKA